MVDDLLSGASESITPFERRFLRTQDVVSRIMTSCSESSLLLKTSAQVDSDLVTYSNQLYVDGEQHHVGTKLVASLMHHFPGYSSSPAHGTGSQRVDKSHPGKTIKAYPLVV